MESTVAALLTDLNILSIIIFLLIAVAVLWRDRENIERYSIVFVRRTQKGIDFLDRVAGLGPRAWQVWATVGVAAGFIILALMFFVVLYYTLRLFFVPDTTVAVAPVLPTASTFTDPMEAGYLGIPFWYFMIGITVVLVVHELMHGVIARVEEFEVEYVGLILLAVIPGAFVQPAGQRDFFEPDENGEQEKHSPWDQGHWMDRLRVLGAGPWANVTAALILAVVLVGGAAALGAMDFTMQDGIEITQVQNGTPADDAGLEAGMHIISIDGNETYSFRAYREATDGWEEGQDVSLGTAEHGTFDVTLTAHPQAGQEQLVTNRSDIEYHPAPVDYLLVVLEQRRSGTVDWYERQVERIEGEDIERELGRWMWINENYEVLGERAEQRVTELEQELQERQTQDEEIDEGAVAPGYLGIGVGVPAMLRTLLILGQLLFIVAFLNIAIGPVNLLPIKGLDGGWMLSILLDRFAPAHEQRVTRIVTLITLGMIIINFAFLLIRFVL